TTGGPGRRRWEKASEQRRVPAASCGSRRRFSASFSPPAISAPAETCCIWTKVVTPHAAARISWYSRTTRPGAPWPPDATGTANAQRNACQPAAEHPPSPAEVGAADGRDLLPALREGHSRPAAHRRLVRRAGARLRDEAEEGRDGGGAGGLAGGGRGGGPRGP